MVRVEQQAARRRRGHVEELSHVFRDLPEFLRVEPVAQMHDAGRVERRNLGGKGGQPEIGVARISFAAAEGLQFAQAGAGVGPCQQLAVRVAAGRMQEHARQAGVGKREIGQHLADGVGRVEQHAAAGASGNRRHEDDLRGHGDEFLARALTGRGDRFGRNHRGNRRLELADQFRAVIHQRQAAQGPQPFRECDRGMRQSHRRRNHRKYFSDAA